MNAKLCEGCGQPLLGAGRADRRHHNSDCRKRAYLRRQREAAEPVAVPSSHVAVLEEALSESRLLACIAKAAPGNWRAAAWLLERRYPERWARGGEAEPAFPRDPGDPFAEVDELARRRRSRTQPSVD